MAHIKCRYSVPFCTGGYDEIRVWHNSWWCCDRKGECPEGRKYKRPVNADPNLANPQCVCCEYKSGEFEKTAKKYEYFDGVLTVAGDTFDEDEIDYLEIDGRVLVDKEKSKADLIALRKEQEQKVGHWVWVQDDVHPDTGNWYCSVCGRMVLHESENTDDTPIFYKRCPVCGAKMEEGEDDKR